MHLRQQGSSAVLIYGHFRFGLTASSTGHKDEITIRNTDGEKCYYLNGVKSDILKHSEAYSNKIEAVLKSLEDNFESVYLNVQE